MDPVFLAIGIPLLPVLASILSPGILRRHAVGAGWLFMLIFVAGATALLLAVPGELEHKLHIPWFPEMGMDVSLRMTSFTAWFGSLILALGGCVFLYACTYFSQNPRLPFLISCLGAFTAAMLGVIWSDNLYILFLFWEATSALSFLLVGFHDEKGDSREKASQALLVTLAGGAAMLAGFVMIHLQFGTATISGILALDPEVIASSLPAAALLLVMLGALTKSAQWPFHFWLPNAMAGPTPVSAFLHSATMVKAGVFLLATLAPAFSAHALWTPLLTTSGILTVATAVLRAAREDDMKAILASTTLAALGFLTILAGVGSPAALLGFVIFLTAHALYKAPLFLAVGNLEKRFGTRSLDRLRGSVYPAPWVGAAIAISALSLIGVAPLPGFLGKEYLLKAVWAYSPTLAVAVALAAAGVLGLGLKLLIPLFDRHQKPSLKAEVPVAMQFAALLPAFGSLVLMAVLPLANHELLGSAATSLGASADASYKLWHGWTPALGLGLLALSLSLVVWRVLSRPRIAPLPATFAPLFDNAFDNVMTMLRETSASVGKMLEAGRLQAQLIVILVAVGALTFTSINFLEWSAPTPTGEGWIQLMLAPVVAVAAIMAARAKRRVTILVALGFVGLLVALLFLWFSAPDLALTQLLAETLLLLLLAGVLFKANPNSDANNEKKDPTIGRFLVAASGGVITTLLILKSMALEWDHPISEFHLTYSKSAAYGANAVNVILVDFRALDTFGEIIVLAIAALGATAALGAPRRRSPLPGSSASPWLRTGGKLVAVMLVPVAIWMFWRGHNAPGGGFIGALFASSAIALCVLNEHPRFHAAWLRKRAHFLMLIGMAVALISALLPVLGGYAFFSGLWWHSGDLHLGTPLLFDLGVFLTVLGFTLGFLRYFQPNKI
ncbi:MAG: hydrogen gas-evolving membrane-bound hydrogenase subunit E [Akkermansiaceae bacterium]